MLKIGVDFHAFDGKFQGSRSHLIGLYRAMVSLCPDFEFVFFLDRVDELRSLSGFDRPNVQCVRMPSANPLLRLAWQLPRLARQHRLDVLHTQYIVPLWPGCRTIVTIHDVLFEPYPEYFTPFFVWRSRWLFRRSAQVADAVMTVSEYSRQEISRRYQVSESRIGLLLNAVDPQVFHPARDDGGARLQRRNLESKRYVLTVGRIEPRKDHATLLRAYAQLGDGAPPLVIVGQRDFGNSAFDHAMKALPPGCDARVLDDVGDAELPVLMQHALALAYPSHAEGFGMPPLEAMACGTPVVTSNSTALPEVVGDAGLLIQPGDVDGLACQLRRLIEQPSLREELSHRSLVRSRAFSWLRAAEVLRQSLLQMSASHKPSPPR
jgi:glycosyltransferase involved in cell wall biosynthesis